MPTFDPDPVLSIPAGQTLADGYRDYAAQLDRTHPDWYLHDLTGMARGLAFEATTRRHIAAQLNH